MRYGNSCPLKTMQSQASSHSCECAVCAAWQSQIMKLNLPPPPFHSRPFWLKNWPEILGEQPRLAQGALLHCLDGTSSRQTHNQLQKPTSEAGGGRSRQRKDPATQGDGWIVRVVSTILRIQQCVSPANIQLKPKNGAPHHRKPPWNNTSTYEGSVKFPTAIYRSAHGAGLEDVPECFWYLA